MRLIDKDYAVDTAWSIDVYHGSTREVCEMLEDAPTVEAIPTDWIIAYIKAKMDKVADMVKADGNEHEMGMEIVEATAINKMLTDWEERKEE